MMIRVENISKTYNGHSKNKTQVLKNVSFELPDKGLFAIYGKSGSGKTTLLNIIGGLEKQDSGEIFIAGECTTGKTDKIRNGNIGFIFQNYCLEKNYTITEILHNQLTIAGFKDKNEIENRTKQALELVKMTRFKNKQGDALSGGQQQRAAIARAIVKGSDIILADEPTGNLDSENTLSVMNILKEISTRKLVVLVTHETGLIAKYADGCLKIEDGIIMGNIDPKIFSHEERNLCEATANAENIDTSNFTKTSSKENGRLFGFKSVFKMFGDEREERAYSTLNIFKQIFIGALAIILCFLSAEIFTVYNLDNSNSSLEDYSLYTGLNNYSEIRKLDSSEYKSVDFFDTQLMEGSFSFGDIAAFSAIKVKYGPVAIESGNVFENIVGDMPEEGEILVSRAIAEEIKDKLELDELKTDKAVLSMDFENDFKISGIIENAAPAVYLNKIDYVNYLGVLSSTVFLDYSGILLDSSHTGNSFTTEIRLAELSTSDDEARVEINRNSLYKFMDNVTEADYLIQTVNAKLAVATKSIQIKDSKIFVKKFEITKTKMETDICVYVNQNVLDNIFIYISPNINALASTSSAKENYYFKLSAQNKQQLETLKKTLNEKGVDLIDVASVNKQNADEQVSDSLGNFGIFAVIVLLMYLIYYFIEKSGSLKNSKEYGVLRAIGVNKGNLLFKELLSALVNNLIGYTLFYISATVLIAVKFILAGTFLGQLIGIGFGVYIISALLLCALSVLPYTFVLRKTPAAILAKYDI